MTTAVIIVLACDACDAGDPARPETRVPSDPAIDCRVPGTSQPSPLRLRRIADRDLVNVLTDLTNREVNILGRDAPADRDRGNVLVGGGKPKIVDVDHLVADVRVDGYDTDSTSLIVTVSKLDGYTEIAEAIAPRIIEAHPCVTTEGDRECALRFAADVGRRAYGRPLDREELDGLLSVYEVGLASESHFQGMQLLAQAIVLSPNTLYRSEIGHAESDPYAANVSLDDYEIASQLSFFLWGTRPDELLLAAAARGELRNNPSNVAVQAERLLRAPRARLQVRRFITGWLGLGAFSTTRRHLNGEFTPAVKLAMQRELDAFTDRIVFDENGSFDSLLESSTTLAEPNLAFIYGTDLVSTDLVRKTSQLDPKHRKGVLSLPAFLTGHATSDGSNPVDRGLFVRNRLLCEELGSPPLQAFAGPIEHGDEKKTTRQKFAQHSSDPACSGCHERIDPVGFGFEGFDLLGRFRTEENSLPVDDSGYLDTVDVHAPFRGPAELAPLIRQSNTARQCFVKQLHRFSEGRTGDACDVESLAGGMKAGKHSIKELILEYLKRPEFYVRSARGGGAK